MLMCTPSGHRHAAGFAMIEVLVTLIIVLVGLLGAAGVLLVGHQSSMEAYQRTQALILLEDMLDRLSANRQAAGCYAVSDPATGAPQLGTGFSGTLSCGSGTPEQQATAISDLQEWSDLLAGAGETNAGGASVGAMIGARGCISLDPASNAYVLTVTWQGLGETAAPPQEVRCARGLYGSDAHRRAITVSTQFANL
jgi:type IV pilus assembly protein PilV